MNLPDLAKSYVRTVVPVVVGLIITLALKAGVNLHGYAPEITAAVTALYYGLARLLEAKLSPAFGWLLGYASPPKYPAPAPAPAAKQAGYGVIELVVGVLLCVFLAVVILIFAQHIH